MKKVNKITIIVVIILVALAIGSMTAIWYINKNLDSVPEDVESIPVDNVNEIEEIADVPEVYFEGDLSTLITKEDKQKIKIKYVDGNQEFETYAEIKFQGTSSLQYDKKNYTITLYQDEKHEKKNKITMKEEWGAQSKYCLKANWIDKTHSRNIVTARIAAAAQDKYGVFADTPHNGTIDGFPIEVYLNNEFLGIYTWNIPKDEWLWNMDDENPDHIVMGAGINSKTTAFEEEILQLSDQNWEIEIGEESEETIEKFNRLIRFVKDSTDEEFKNNYEQYIDKDSMFNYIAVFAASEALDNITKNLMLVTYDGKVWSPSLYDLDSTFGTNYYGYTLESYDEIEERINTSLLFKRTIEAFPNEIADRYFELREEILTKDNIMEEFQEFKASIPQTTFEKEAVKWGTVPGQDIQQISEFLDYRLPLVDEYMNGLYEK